MKTVIYFLICYLILLGASYYFQEKLIFFPQKLDKDYNFQLPNFGQELMLETADGIKINAILYAYPTHKKIIIYFHGNAGSLAGWKEAADKLLALGCNVLMIDYRGYGKSEGTFSEKGLYNDGEAAYEYVKKQGYADNQIIFYGRSLGSGVAVEMALRHPVYGLILETPYTSLPKLAMNRHWFLFPTLLSRYHFDNLTKIAQLKIPILLLHGSDDELIPISHSEKLNQYIKTPKTFIIIPHGQHNNLNSFPLYEESIKDFLHH